MISPLVWFLCWAPKKGNPENSVSSSDFQENIVSGLPGASVFLLSDMEWDGLRPRLGGYILYSSITVMMININDTVLEFTLDQVWVNPLRARAK